VLGNGADAYHDTHIHIDLMGRTNNYKICEWDVLDMTETAALAAKKAAAVTGGVSAVMSAATDVPLPRPRPVANAEGANFPQHRRVYLRVPDRRPAFRLIAPLSKHTN
jgi:hypothetical protein